MGYKLFIEQLNNPKIKLKLVVLAWFLIEPY